MATTKNKAPKEVRSSEFGCGNCLWASCECVKGSKYIATAPVELDKKTVPTCKSYAYYN